MHPKAQNLAGLQPGVGHVVAVSHPGHRLALNRAPVFDECEDVGQDLAGVKFIGQAVDHRHPRVAGKALDLGLLVGADHHQVHHAADDAGAVLYRLCPAELAVAGGQMHHAAAQLVHARLKADPGAGRRLFENHGHRAVGQRLMPLVGLEFFFDQRGPLEQISVVVGTEVTELQVVFHGSAANSFFTRGHRMATTSSASAVLMISGGTRRITLSAVTLISRP